MLHKMRTVLAPTVLASWTQNPTAPATRQPRVLLENVDPRLVLVPQLWVTRGPASTPGDGVYVTWSAFSVGYGQNGDQVVLRVIAGADSRVIGPTLTPRTLDGIATAGDNLEMSAATPILIVAACNSGGLDGPDTQKLWFKLDAYPAETSLTPGDYEGLIQAVKVQISNTGTVECLSP
jgi:hypothetical protein